MGENPQLVAATRPIPLGLVTDLALSNDDQYLYASYPLGGGVYVFDVEEMIKTWEHPTDYIIDQFGRPQGSRFFEALYQRPANILDFAAVPIDDINPKISIAADYGIIAEDRVRNQFTYGVSESSTSAPVNVGITRNLAVSPPDLLTLTSPNGIKEGDLTPTFTWDFQIPDEQVKEVNLFVSTFAEGKGLLPWDRVVDLSDSEFLPELSEQQKQQLLTKSWDGYDDFNPGRIVTATWKRETNTWYSHDGTTIVAQPTHDPANNNTRFTLPDITTLTAGQNYHWAVQAVSSTGQSELEFGNFNTITPFNANPFSSVTVLTHGFTLKPTNTGIPDNFYDLADSITSGNGNLPSEKGLILRYDKPTGLWIPVDNKARVLADLTGGLNPGDKNYLVTLANNIKSVYVNQNKALVLLPEWSTDGESTEPNSGFTEAAADAIFASIVQLDQALGGDVGEHDASGNLVRLYDDKGDLIRTQGALFDSPLHFIAFSRGTVVNSEIIQRLGTYFPYAGGKINADGTPVVDGNGKEVRDLQMTTIDPHDFYQESLKVDLAIPGTPIIKDFRDFNEPQVQVWNNITFADNYYQTVADPNGSTWTPNGRSIDGADIDIQLDGRTGFTSDDRKGSPHGNAFSWYAGTADLAIDEVDNGYTRKARPVYDQLGDKDIQELLNSNNVKLASWYPLPENQGSTEGIGTGWFYSVLGGGQDKRLQSSIPRTLVSDDNTSVARMRGDYAVPTLFDGNFDAITAKIDSQPVPGWSLNNGANYTSLQSGLKKWSEIGLGDSDNFALQLGSNESITHNSFVVPDWGVLRFDLYTGDVTADATSKLRVTIQATDGSVAGVSAEINLQDARGTAGEYLADTRRIGYGEKGFETFTLDVPEALRGRVATVSFVLNGGNPVYLDNVFFKSQHLLLGNPDNARSNPNDVNNYLIEKPQYAVSYNNQTKNPNWVSWRIDKSWIGDSTNSVPRSSLKLTDLPPNYPPNTDYSAKSGSEPWISDPELPITTFPVRVEGADLNNAVSSGTLDRGHLTAFRDRDRNAKDAIATFLTTNLIPQNTENNTLNSAWENFESYLENTLVSKGRELYVIAGGYYNSNQTRFVVNNTIVDSNGDFVLDSNNRIKTGTPNDLSTGESLKGRTNPKQITVPDFTWKIAVVLEPGQQIADIRSNTQVIAIITPNQNTLPSSGGSVQLPNQPLRIAVNKWSYWPSWRVDVNYLEEITGYDFFSNLPDEIEEAIESDNSSDLVTPLQAAPLLAGSEFIPFSDASISFRIGGGDNSTIGQDSVVHIPTQSSSFLFSIPEVSTDHGSFHSITVPDVSSLKISFIQKSHTKIGSFQVGISENSPPQVGTEEKGSSKISPFEIDFFKANLFQIDSSQVNPTKISLPSSIAFQQFLSIHNPTPTSINTYKDNPQNLWNTLFDPSFNFTFQITDLPVGQLAEAQITNYDTLGRPNGGTILIDADANGIGWFIDPTPLDNTEFSQTLTDTAFRATTGDAYGKYDLLTSILHEMGHLAGIISGYTEFDHHIQTVNGSKFFRGDNFTASLTPDGSHIDSKLYPFDLMNTSLSPGVRKLPSLIDLQILNAVRSLEWGSGRVGENTLQAPLNSDPLIGILNGDFDTQADWSTRGAANILNSQAILTEDSPFNSNFTQTFIIPEHAKYLQFTILDTHLGTNEFAPNDAFEVALLDARTLTPLVGTSIGLTQTDSLLNLQQTGNAYFSDKVKIAGANTSGDKIALNTPRTVKIDISNIAPGTLATLYFDLLGFGAKDGKVIIDNVMLLDKDLISPTATDDTATTDQAKPVLINILANDSDADGTINPSTVQIGTAPHTGSIIINSDGTLTYTPNNTFVGIDTFTYIVLDYDYAISNEATVTVNINNIAPIIDRITVESNLIEGTIATFSATASDPGDNLTYTWNFGDDSNPVTGQTLNHTFADNGTYTAILTVTDTHGASTVETLLLNVINVAPIVNPGADITTDEGTAITFNGSFIDLGIKDTHTITWDFGDGSATTSILNPTHTYTKDGIYTATLIVTDKDGGTNSNSLTVTVNNTDPIINNISGDTNIFEGTIANFSATATDSGLDTLTYTWNFGDDSDPVIGQNVNHIFAQDGNYIVNLTVTDTNGGATSETLSVQVNNAAPIITNISGDTNIFEGAVANFSAIATERGNDITVPLSPPSPLAYPRPVPNQ